MICSFEHHSCNPLRIWLDSRQSFKAMKSELIHSLTNDFESFSKKTEGGIEFWLASDLQHLLGYSKWRNFVLVINKAKIACEVSGHGIGDHFVDVNKMVQIESQTMWKTIPTAKIEIAQLAH